MKEGLHDKVCEMARGSRGGFVAKLAEAWLHADSGNQQKIQQAFPDLFWIEPTYEELHDFVTAFAASKMQDNQALRGWAELARTLTRRGE